MNVFTPFYFLSPPVDPLANYHTLIMKLGKNNSSRGQTGDLRGQTNQYNKPEVRTMETVSTSIFFLTPISILAHVMVYGVYHRITEISYVKQENGPIETLL